MSIGMRASLAAALGLTPVILLAGPATAAETAVAVDDDYVTDEGVPLDTTNPVRSVRDNDPTAALLPAVLVSDPTHGTVEMYSTGRFVYVPDPGFHGADSFTYRLGDGTGSSNVATVRLTVRPADRALVAAPDAYTSPAGVDLVVGAPGLLANDSSPDGLPLRAVIVDGPDQGTLSDYTGAQGAFRYTPWSTLHGVDSFAYVLTDGVAYSSPVTVTIRVRGSGPQARHDAYVLDEDTTLVVDGVLTNGVLANDPGPSGVPVTAAVVSGTRHGALSLAPDGTFTYVPDAGFSGTDLFVYQASDDLDTSNLGLVMLTVVPRAVEL